MRRGLCTPAAVLALCGCADAGAARVPSRVAMEHGLAPGDRIAATTVKCPQSADRVIGAAGETQIVTFATPFDCTACAPHLAGVPKVERDAGVADRAFAVVWSPRLQSLDHDLGTSRPDLPLCTDERGTLWDRHNLLHTPFTAVIRDGRVIYMHDGTLLTHRDQLALANDLRRALATE